MRGLEQARAPVRSMLRRRILTTLTMHMAAIRGAGDTTRRCTWVFTADLAPDSTLAAGLAADSVAEASVADSWANL
jgi:hypothetical protein